MKLAYILPLIFIVSACNNMMINNSTECKEYIQTIKNSWPDKTDGYHLLTNYETIWNDNKSCLIGKSKKEIQRIFGEPDNVSSHYLHFYLKKECTYPKGNQGGCVTLTFSFNEKDKVTAMQEPFIWPDNQQ